jgi:hypothetical protein
MTPDKYRVPRVVFYACAWLDRLGGFGTLWIAKPSLTQKRLPGPERESPRCANPKVDPLHLWIPSDLACGP